MIQELLVNAVLFDIFSTLSDLTVSRVSGARSYPILECFQSLVPWYLVMHRLSQFDLLLSSTGITWLVLHEYSISEVRCTTSDQADWSVSNAHGQTGNMASTFFEIAIPKQRDESHPQASVTVWAVDVFRTAGMFEFDVGFLRVWLSWFSLHLRSTLKEHIRVKAILIQLWWLLAKTVPR